MGAGRVFVEIKGAITNLEVLKITGIIKSLMAFTKMRQIGFLEYTVRGEGLGLLLPAR